MPSKKADTGAEPKQGKVLKVLLFDEGGEQVAETKTHQIPEDPFGSYTHGLQQPPLAVEQLVFLAEAHPTHGPALEQKAADVIGYGWEWRKKDEDTTPDEGQRKKLANWFESLTDPNEDETMHETLLSAVLDMETIGYGTVEIARGKGKKQSEIENLYYMPSHTVRFARDGLRIAQERSGKRVWFKRWLPNDEHTVDKVTGKLAKPGEQVKNPGNEVLVFKRPSRRSSWYGIPSYVSALGWISLSQAARDDNIMWFDNRREPRWAVIMSNLEDDPDLEDALRQAFARDLKQPHRNIFIPISGPGEIKFQQLGDNKGDMSFAKLQDRADQSILLAHRIPQERLGLAKVGALGGNVAEVSVRTYKESYVQTTQAIIAARVNRLVETEGPVKNPGWLWHPGELDLTDATADRKSAAEAFLGMVMRLNEARVVAGLEALDDGDDRGGKFWFELAPPPGSPGALAIQTASDTAAQSLDQQINQLLGPNQGQDPKASDNADRSGQPYRP